LKVDGDFESSGENGLKLRDSWLENGKGKVIWKDFPLIDALKYKGEEKSNTSPIVGKIIPRI